MKETILRMSIIPDRQRPPGGEENESALIYFCFDLLNVPQLGCSRNEPIFIFFLLFFWLLFLPGVLLRLHHSRNGSCCGCCHIVASRPWTLVA